MPKIKLNNNHFKRFKQIELQKESVVENVMKNACLPLIGQAGSPAP